MGLLTTLLTSITSGSGGGGGTGADFVQPVASVSGGDQVVNHMLNFTPLQVLVVDNTGVVWADPGITYNNANTLTVTLGGPFTGNIYLYKGS